MATSRKPNLIIYWADTKKPLKHMEFANLDMNSTILSVRPSEVLLEDNVSKRKVIISAAHAPGTPEVPAPKSTPKSKP